MRDFINSIFLTESWNIGQLFQNLGSESNWFEVSDEHELSQALSILKIKDADRFTLPTYILVHGSRAIMAASIDHQTGKVNHSALQGGHQPDAGWSRFTLALEQKLSGEDRLEEGDSVADANTPSGDSVKAAKLKAKLRPGARYTAAQKAEFRKQLAELEREEVTEGEEYDWYQRRHELEPGMVFRDFEGDLVKLDQRNPGDGTQWIVATWWGSSWSYDNTVIEPGDLRGPPVADPAEKVAEAEVETDDELLTEFDKIGSQGGDEFVTNRAVPKSPDKFLRVNAIMHKIIAARPTDEDSATRLLQDINYLLDAVKEFAARRGAGDHVLTLQLRKAVMDAQALLPRDGDIEYVLSNPHVMRNVHDAIAGLRTALKDADVMVEGEDEEEGGEERLDELFGLSKKDKARKAAGVLLQVAQREIEHAKQSRDIIAAAHIIDASCANLYSHRDVFEGAGLELDTEISKMLGRKGRGSPNMGSHLRGNFYVQNIWREGDLPWITMRTLYGAEALLDTCLSDHPETDPWKPSPEGVKRPNVKIDHSWAIWRPGMDGHTHVWFAKSNY